MSQKYSPLRILIRRILSEELVSIIRKSQEDMYDAEFDEDGRIISGTKFDTGISGTGDDFITALSVAEKFTTVDKATVMKKIMQFKSAGNELFAPLSGIDQAVSVMNEFWLDTLSWPRPSGKGAGEAAMHLAFESDLSAREPDFVSADGSVKIALKYMGPSGKTPVRTGGSSGMIRTLILNIQDLLELGPMPTDRAWGPKDLDLILSGMDPDGYALLHAVEALKEKFDEIKVECVREHGSDGVIICDDSNGFYSVTPETAQSDIQLVYFKAGGTRVEFGGVMFNGNSLDKVLKKFM